MPKDLAKGAEEARAQLPELLTAAERGVRTVIMRRGRAVAELVPVGTSRRPAQSIIKLKASGRGLWGTAPAKAVERLRDEWDR
jgi:antitoxin (DNA-binding transcriptional repressor) of toxin-antitoxin stability system